MNELAVNGMVTYEAQLDLATLALTELHERADGGAAGPVEFRTWIPRSERRQRQRLFVQSSAGGEPAYVAKIPLDPDDAMASREWQVLSTLNGTGVARPRAIRRLGDGFVMSYVPWKDFPEVMAAARPQEWPALLCSAADVAARLHTSWRRAGSAPGQEPWQQATGADPVAVAASYLPAHVVLPAATLDWLGRARVAPTHGDLGPWNLRVDRHGAIALIDWEDYRSAGLPALDVLNLVLTAALIAFPDYRERGFAWLFDKAFHGRNTYRCAATAAFARYRALTGTDVQAIVGLTPLFCRWMVRRIADQGRPTAHLFFTPFAEYFEAETPRWEDDHG